MENLKTIKETAKILNVHANTVRRLIKEEKLQFSKVGVQYRISQEQIDKLLKN